MRRVLYFDDIHADVCVADVFNRVRRQRFDPLDSRDFMRRKPEAAVEQDIAILIAPDEIAPAQHVHHSRPAVGVHGNKISYPNMRVDNAHVFVFEQHGMVLRSGYQCVERLGPWPCFFIRFLRFGTRHLHPFIAEIVLRLSGLFAAGCKT